jgi:NodT family efflux transporter outer membrane factor (OMF) lipoprotein
VRDLNGDLTPWFHDESYGLSLNASWEVDLWGRLRNLHQATIEDYGATEADFHGARLSLAGGIARAWFNVIAARQQVDLARWTRDEFQNSFQVVERIYKATGETALSVQFSLNNVASAERTLLARQLGLGEARRSLELLLGRYPSATIEARDKLPENILGPVPAGLPSGLLTRRPDLVAAAADLRASSERADAARKNLLPSIRLSAGGSSPSDKLANLLARPSSIAWNLAASITQPVFEGGALGAQARQAKARNDAAVQSFTSIALRAFREVESALETERSLASQEVFLGTEQAQAILAEAQALRDFTEGVGDYLPVLESQRRASNARASMISLQNQRLQTRIGLYLALGGDFEAAPDDDLAPRLASVEEPRLQTLPNEQ